MTTSKRDIEVLLAPLMVWARVTGYRTYDWWDLWATRWGAWAKDSYTKLPVAGAVGVAPMIALDLLWPGSRRSFASKRSFPICHAHFGLGFLNLYESTGDERHLADAQALVKPLIEMASPKIPRLGWGMKHDWMTVKGMVPKDTPCHTQTAYVYDFFARLAMLSGEAAYTRYLASIAEHEATDFPEWAEDDRLVSSYSTSDTRRVVNANSYRMYVLLDAGKRFGNSEYSKKGLATLRYVLSMQREDGSWPYAEDELFVDNYHTCFVIKNLYRIREFAGDLRADLQQSLKRGLTFYLDRLYDASGFPIPFAVKPRATLYRYDSYDLAESIGLLAELGIERDRLCGLLRFARERFQTSEGWFRFRLYPFMPAKGIPYMRYANSAMFLALTKVYKIAESD